MAFRYYLINRPPAIATHPGGETGREVWAPTRKPAAPLPLHGDARYYHGWVEYPEALDLDQVYKWELWPGDPAEAARYTFYLEADRDLEAMEDMILDYVQAGRTYLKRLAARGVDGNLAQAALVLMDAAAEDRKVWVVLYYARGEVLGVFTNREAAEAFRDAEPRITTLTAHVLDKPGQ